MNTTRAEELFEKYRNGTLTGPERLDLDAWYNDYYQSAATMPDSTAFDQRLKEMDAAFPFRKNKVGKVKLWPRIAAAASIIIAIGTGLYFYAGKDIKSQTVYNLADINFKAGKNSATLTLANGRKIVLSDAVNGKLAEESGVTITKNADGQVVYKVSSSSAAVSFNTLTTVNGEEYQVILPDLTKVWLNAASSIKFPTTFARAEDRKVELSGEAYFEVAKDARHPFIVKTADQEVKVLGTHFNINSYADEPVTKTTLLEGKVKVTPAEDNKANKYTAAGPASTYLSPGQQAILDNQSIQVVTVDTEEATAWKNGMFQFDEADIKTVMGQISRWYNVDVEFAGKIPADHFRGKVPRDSKISAVLKIIELSGVNFKFKIEGRKIIIE